VIKDKKNFAFLSFASKYLYYLMLKACLCLKDHI